MKKIITSCLVIFFLAGCAVQGNKGRKDSSKCSNQPVAVIKVYDSQGNLVKK